MFKKVSSLLVAVVIAGMSLVSLPSAALAIGSTVTVDCTNPPNGGYLFIPPIQGDVLFNTTNCFAITANGAAAGTSHTVHIADLVSFPGASYVLRFYINETTQVAIFSIHLANPDATSLSPLNLARTDTMTISGTAPEFFTVTSNQLGGNPNCGIDNSGTAQHAYVVLPVTVTQTGNYTFRVVGTSPDSQVTTYSLDTTAYSTMIDDTFLAVYSNFDPLHPDDNLISCNDDRSDVAAFLTDGTVLRREWSQFDATLAAGDYTIVLTTFVSSDLSSWQANTNSQDQTAYIQLWGPSGAIASNTPNPTPTPSVAAVSSTTAESELASTGNPFDRVLVFSAMAIVLGVAAIAILRRRRSN